MLTIVQGETSNGVLNIELPEITKIAKELGVLVIVDAVCTLTTMPLNMDEWQIDVAITGGQKGLSSIPGVSLLAFSSDAWEVLESRTAVRPHWCLDAIRAQRCCRESSVDNDHHNAAHHSGTRSQTGPFRDVVRRRLWSLRPNSAALAIESLRAPAIGSPEIPGIHNAAGLAAQTDGDLEAAIAHFERAVQLNARKPYKENLEAARALEVRDPADH